MTIKITTAQLPTGITGYNYFFELKAKVSPPSEIIWSCINSLPPNINLNKESGVLSGLCSEASFLSSLTFTATSTNSSDSDSKVLNITIVNGWTFALLRDSLQEFIETDTALRSSCLFKSPDIIVNPLYLIKCYQVDYNQPLVQGKNNSIYIRAKNMSFTNIRSTGYIYLYWCLSSLLPLPDQWIQNRMSTSDIFFPPVTGGGITVISPPFNWTPPELSIGCHYGFIGITSTISSQFNKADIPVFSDWLSFVTWMRNLYICCRNIAFVFDFGNKRYTKLDKLNYPFSTNVVMLLQIKLKNVPLNSNIELKNDNLHIHTIVTTDSLNQVIYSNGVFCQKNFSGDIETSVQLADRSSWSHGAQITVTLFFGVNSTTSTDIPDYDFGVDAEHINVIKTKRLMDDVAGKLIPVGASTMIIQKLPLTDGDQ